MTPMACSIADYLGRLLGSRYCPGTEGWGVASRPVEPTHEPAGVGAFDVGPDDTPPALTILEGPVEPGEVSWIPPGTTIPVRGYDGPPCDNCGHLTERAGTCFRCPHCGNSLGCS